MPDYQKMYALLFNKITDSIAGLQEAQALAEQLYIDSAPDFGVVAFPSDTEKNRPQK